MRKNENVERKSLKKKKTYLRHLPLFTHIKNRKRTEEEEETKPVTTLAVHSAVCGTVRVGQRAEDNLPA